VALDSEFAEHSALLQREAALYASGSEAQNRVLDLELRAQERYQDQVKNLTRQALDAQARDYVTFGNAITGAFNSQLHGCYPARKLGILLSRTRSRTC